MKLLLLTYSLFFFTYSSISQVTVGGVRVGSDYFGETVIRSHLGGLSGILYIKQPSVLDARVQFITFHPSSYGYTKTPVSFESYNKFVKKIEKKYRINFIEQYNFSQPENFHYDRFFVASKYEFVFISGLQYLNEDTNRIVFHFTVLDTTLYYEYDKFLDYQ